MRDPHTLGMEQVTREEFYRVIGPKNVSLGIELTRDERGCCIGADGLWRVWESLVGFTRSLHDLSLPEEQRELFFLPARRL